MRRSDTWVQQLLLGARLRGLTDLAFGAGWWYFRKPSGGKRFAYMAAFPLLWWVINWTYLTAIPGSFQ